MDIVIAEFTICFINIGIAVKYRDSWVSIANWGVAGFTLAIGVWNLMYP